MYKLHAYPTHIHPTIGARMPKDFSNPHKLGFMRFIEVIFVINICFSFIQLTFMIKGDYTIGFVNILDYLNLIFEGIALWMMWQRKKATRAFFIGYTLFNFVSGSIFNIATGDFSLASQLSASGTDLALLLYFCTSRRVKAVMIEPLNTEALNKQIENDRLYYRPKTWPFWRNLIIYLCVFSVVGHWMEAGYCTLIRFGILPGTYDPNSQIWSDWLYPFPVYGVGAVVCVLLLFPIKNYLQKKLPGHFLPVACSFVINGIVCTLIELVMGLMINQPSPEGVYPLWDYSTLFCNFMGQICLQNGLAFGVIATLMTWIIYPLVEYALGKLPRDAMNIIFVSVVVGFCILFLLYCVNILAPDYLIKAKATASVATFAQ